MRCTVSPCGTVSRLDVWIPLSGPSLSAFFVRTARGRRSGFLAFASGIVRVVISVIVAQLAAYGVANLHY